MDTSVTWTLKSTLVLYFPGTIFDVDFLLDVFHVSEQLRKCDLTIEERCVLKGIALMSRGTCTFNILVEDAILLG